jgi:outer membrane immunogenic protein
MKKGVLLTLVSLTFCAASYAQVRIGGFLGYGSEIEQLAIGANAEFFLNEKMAIAPSIAFYLPQEDGPVKTNLWELNGNFHYYFVSEDMISVYGLGGLNFTTVHVKFDGFGADFDDSQTEIGLNLGGGINFKVTDKIIPFGELKYAISDFDQVAIFFGVKFQLSE